MRRLIRALAAAPMFLGAAAFAQPAQQPTRLSDTQMDAVSAGFQEIDTSNTSFVLISIIQRSYLLDPSPNGLNPTPDGASCQGCYLQIVSPLISIGARFGP
jgi:hypothetical protein